MGKNHIWEVVFWKNEHGNCPAAETMKQIIQANKESHKFICDKIRKFSEDWNIGDFLRSKYIEDLKNGLWEYKISVNKMEFRMLGVLEYPRSSVPQFVCFHSFYKKSRKIPQPQMELALERFKKYKGQ